jgi:general nucleoside transport system permease protein
MSTLALAARPVQRLGTAKAIGLLGILLGLIACWVALPPIHARGFGWPLIFGILALAAGIVSVTRGGGRAGWGAIAAALVGMSLGISATQSGLGNLDLVFAWAVLLGATLRYATPLAFAAMGGLFSERSGVVNIGLEGMMLMGAFWGFWGTDRFNSWVLGLVVAMVAGAALALVHAFFCINLQADQIVVGTGINFLALGITGYAFVDI